jgi:DNA-binding response OmpR family regulator
MSKILVVDDDSDILEVIAEALELENYEVEAVSDSSVARGLLKYSEFDLILLDWDLPGISGLELCSSYRRDGGNSPVIIFTGKSQVKDKVHGLEVGADDYLTKPFHMQELVARVKAHLRRVDGKFFVGDDLSVGPIKLNPVSHRVWCEGKEIKLLPKEFTILELFLRHPNRVFSAEAIISRVWESKAAATPDTIRSYIMNLRKKLLPCDLLETVHGVGYRLKEEETEKG